MNIQGLQKMTLLDFPGKVACTVFLGGCDLRCPFCHNASLVTHIDTPPIDEAEVFAYLEKRKGILEGLCLTGGEPLLYEGVEDFLRKVRSLGLAVKLDTNGSRPEVLKELVSRGLVDYVAMDIKNSPSRYSQTSGIPGLAMEKIEESMAFLLTGSLEYEFRTTLVREFHTAQDVESIGQ